MLKATKIEKYILDEQLNKLFSNTVPKKYLYYIGKQLLNDLPLYSLYCNIERNNVYDMQYELNYNENPIFSDIYNNQTFGNKLLLYLGSYENFSLFKSINHQFSLINSEDQWNNYFLIDHYVHNIADKITVDIIVRGISFPNEITRETYQCIGVNLNYLKTLLKENKNETIQ